MKANIDVEKARKDGWIESWFVIEVLGGSQEIVESSLKEHIDKLSKTENVLIHKAEYQLIQEVKNPPKPLQRGWSQIVNITAFTKDLFTLLHIAMLYGPSAIEILSPNTKQIPASEMQNIVNTLAGLVHQFAAAGVGGIVLTPSGPKQNV